MNALTTLLLTEVGRRLEESTNGACIGIVEISTNSFNLKQLPPTQLNQTQKMKHLVVRPPYFSASGPSMVMQFAPPIMGFRACLTLNQDVHPKSNY
ncbi:uncharacterized protein DS421_3g69540 [Arachis hypogaea]|nr:uncharacterized protein DS421_3g69540 [Arachis hypogaea]